ncbi:MAG: hypothetical protein E7018_04195 [Alphaproteobacteria bacterium]|nr:hypothetical protein [Alphaproteobacteria bacterium]
MFFNKFSSSPTQTSSPQKIHFLGISAQSLYLASILQNKGHNISIICTPPEADELHATDIILKDKSHLQNQRYKFNYIFEQTSQPDILFIASDIPFLRKDLLLASPRQLHNTKTINLTPTAPSTFTSELLNIPTTNAYLHGWLQKDKNIIIQSSNNYKLIISTPKNSPVHTTLSSLFENSLVECCTNENDTENLWKWLIPQAISILLETNGVKNIYSYSKTENGRKTIDSLLKELSAIASSREVSLNHSSILTQLHSQPENNGFLTKNTPRNILSLHLQCLSQLLFQGISPNNPNYPVLHQMINSALNKY